MTFQLNFGTQNLFWSTNNDNYNCIVNISEMTEYYYKSVIIFDKHEIFYIKE